MPTYVNLSPNPKSHIMTLSRIGYNLNSAISDIIDNSITANATTIHIELIIINDKPAVIILDDGSGMEENTLTDSMRIGCKDPSIKRDENDLGRFGSGMKMASFSQARKLTVFSKSNNSGIKCVAWDIDVVEKSNNWNLATYSANETFELCKRFNIRFSSSGTAVVWENISKYVDFSRKEIENLIGQNIESLRSYIRLHFHKFMTGKNAIKFYINNQIVEYFDPFLRSRNGYQEGPSQSFRVKKGGRIELRVHILPHESKLSKSDLERLGGSDKITATQGLYVYRANRLIISGGWFGLTRLSQLGKLARVEVNVPTSLDDEWSTDVKKSSLDIPHKVKSKLRQLIREPISRSKRAYRYRGRLEEANAFWKVNENEREGSISYQVAIDNNSLNQILEGLDKKTRFKFLEYLANLSKEIPIHHIYERMSSDPNRIDQSHIDCKRNLKELREQWKKDVLKIK